MIASTRGLMEKKLAAFLGARGGMQYVRLAGG
jgi:hypothetical protein